MSESNKVEEKKHSPEEVKEIQAAARHQNTHDPVTEERINKERMFARERLKTEHFDKAVEDEMASKVVGDLEKEAADAQAKVDAAKVALEVARKDAIERDKEAAKNKK
jgi:hypothetical protein